MSEKIEVLLEKQIELELHFRGVSQARSHCFFEMKAYANTMFKPLGKPPKEDES